jgi:hypothetical protein
MPLHLVALLERGRHVRSCLQDGLQK